MLIRTTVAVGVIALLSVAWSMAGVVRGETGEAPRESVAPANYAGADAVADGSLKRPVQTGAPNGRAGEVEVVRALARQRGGEPAALAQVIQLAREFEDALAAEIIDELAAAHYRAGDLNLAAESRKFLLERFPEQPLARRAALWLVRLYASGEVGHARRGQSQGAADLRRQLSPAMASALKAAPETIAGGETASGSRLPKPGDPLATYALQLATNAMSRDAALADDPTMVFQRAVAARRGGQEKSSQAMLSPLRHRGADDAWGQCARAEAWLVESRQDAAPKVCVHCTAAEQPPHLDGILNDAVWQAPVASRGVPAPGANHEPPPDIRWAYDREHLYLAVQCRKITGVDYTRDDRPRPRDGNVESHDRVRLLLDVDRDYASWFELTVDSRGWTADGCWGDAAWNPTWYVASGETADGGSWTIEAAIPLAEFTATTPSAGAAWACAVEGLTPTVGAASDSRATAREPEPAEFSLLLFE